MRSLFAILVLMALLSCEKEDEKNFPITYSFEGVDQSREALYLMETSVTYSHLPFTTGTWGEYRDSVKAHLIEIQREILDLKEITLLNEDSVRIHFIYDSIEYDTVVNYAIIQDSISIEGISGLFDYEKETDRFVLCSAMTAPLPGPNVNNPVPPYNQLDIIGCIHGYSNDNYIHDLISNFEFQPLDTIILQITRMHYERD